MKELRALLIDCRIELRRLVRDFHKLPLCERLDAAIQLLAQAADRAAVQGALATAVPQLGDGGDRLGVALARIDCLVTQATRVATAITPQTVAEEESRIPSAELIAAIAAGARQFTQAQREWCVGEAMVLSGFEFTPMELIEQGDAHIARIIATARGGQ